MVLLGHTTTILARHLEKRDSDGAKNHLEKAIDLERFGSVVANDAKKSLELISE